jgi:O-methyltransferase involved in polyketide biosynthesis
VTWCDVDYPEVIDVRAKIFPARDHYRMIASSVIAPQWLQQVPADLLTLIVAEELTMYLRPDEGHQLFRRITDHSPRGIIAFDTHNWVAIRLMNARLARVVGAAVLHWGIDDPRELERIDPRLQAKSRHTEQENATWRARGRDTPGD